MRYRASFYLVTFLISFSLQGAAAASAKQNVPPQARGIFIHYKNRMTKAELLSMDRLHRRLKLSLVQRLPAASYDILRLQKRQPESRERTAIRLNLLCKEFLKLKSVSSCQLDWEVVSASGTDTATCSNNPVLPTGELQAVADSCPCDLQSPLEAPGSSLRKTELWAQEYVGADLAKDLVAKEKSNDVPVVAVFDSDFTTDFVSKLGGKFSVSRTEDRESTHGTQVASLIGGSRASVGTKAIFWPAEIHKTSDFLVAEVALNEQKLKPKLVNNSQAWRDRAPCEVFQRLAGNGAIPVVAAGNDFASPVEQEKSSCHSVIIVGNLAESGWVSLSNESESVTISAPAGNGMMAGGTTDDSPTSFEGSSASSPEVTGALLNAVTFLPELTLEQAREMLKRTALLTPESYQTPQKNGAGMLNAYRLAFVAKQIRDKCRDTKNRSQCQNQAISDPRSYKHAVSQAQADSLKKHLAHYFPNCLTSPPTSDQFLNFRTCGHKQVFDDLRQAALLDPAFSEGWKHLACIERQIGATANAQFYDLIAVSGTGDLNQMAGYIAEKVLNEPGDTNALEALARLPEGIGLPTVEKLFAKEDIDIRRSVMQLLFRGYFRGGRGLESKLSELMKKGLSDPDQEVREITLQMAMKFNPELGAPFLKRTFESQDPAIRRTAIRASSEMGEKGIPYLKSALSDSDAETRAVAAYYAARLGMPALELVREALSNESTWKTRTTIGRGDVISHFVDAAEKASLPFLEELSQSPDRNLRGGAIMKAGRIEAFSIIRKGLSDPDPDVRNLAKQEFEMFFPLEASASLK